MRSGLLAVAVALITACGARAGLQFEIDATADPAATEIMVYIGGGDGTDASIAGRGQTPSTTFSGQFFPFAFADVETLALSGNHQTISFIPGEGTDKISIVVIGLTGGQPTSVGAIARRSVRTDLVEVWTVALEKAAPSVTTPTGRAALQWGEQPEDLTCVQAVDRDAKPENIFIGIPEDRDCDGLHAKHENGTTNLAECNDDWFGAVITPRVDNLSCMEELDAFESGGSVRVPVCTFGGQLCTDNMPNLRVDCSHDKLFCAPASVCAACASGTEQQRFDCAVKLDLPQHSADVEYARCAIRVNTAVSPPVVCPQTLTASPPFGWYAGTNVTCASGASAQFRGANRSRWSDKYTAGGITVAFAADAGAPSGSCGIALTPTRSPNQNLNISDWPHSGLVAVEHANQRGIVAPMEIVVTEVQTCVDGAPTACTRSTATVNDSISKCLLGDVRTP